MKPEVAICIKDGKVQDVKVGEITNVAIPETWKECDYIIHSHNFSEQLSQTDIQTSQMLGVPVCSIFCINEEDKKVCKSECVYPLKEEANVDWAKVYTFEKIIGHLRALEEHFLSYPCWNDCIPKHIFTLKVYLEEAASMGINPALMQEISNYLDALLYSKELSEASEVEIVNKLREFRKAVWEEFKSYISQFVPAQELNEFKCIRKDEWKWEEKKPKTPSERYDVLKRCGSECFLDPTAQPPKFPICNKYDCCLDCDGLRAAYVRARALISASKRAGREDLAKYYEEIAERARSLAVQHGCTWAREELGEDAEERVNISFSDWELQLMKYISKGGSLLFPEGKKYDDLPEEQKNIINMLIGQGLIKLKRDRTGWYMTDKGKVYFFRLRRKIENLINILKELDIDVSKLREIKSRLEFFEYTRAWWEET